MSYMDRLRARVSEIRLPDELTKPTQPGFVSFVSDAHRHFSENNDADEPIGHATTMITAMASRSAPRGVDRAGWEAVVDDTRRLIGEGWAAHAIGLGWSLIDLFGVEPAGSDDDYRYGLAAWMAGRPLVLLEADSAIVRVGDVRSVFNRKRDRTGAIYIWNLGRQA